MIFEEVKSLPCDSDGAISDDQDPKLQSGSKSPSNRLALHSRPWLSVTALARADRLWPVVRNTRTRLLLGKGKEWS